MTYLESFVYNLQQSQHFRIFGKSQPASYRNLRQLCQPCFIEARDQPFFATLVLDPL
jgi:hypothetical protein